MSKSALVLLLPGLGDALVASPIIRALSVSEFMIDALTMLPPVAEYAAELPEIRNTISLPLLTSPIRCIPALLTLRRRAYDIAVVPFPATRWQYAFIALIIGAKRLLIHRYGGAATTVARIAGAEQVELLGGHRWHENNRLANRIAQIDTFGYCIPASWALPRRDGVLGIHPGSMSYKGNELRRWPMDRFLALARAQIDAGRHVRLFFGPNEISEIQLFKTELGEERAEFIVAGLRHAARKVSECEVFLANDSGFAHLAAALNVKVLTLFGMTDPLRAAPIGTATPLRGSLCPPCHDEGADTFSCVRDLDFKCMKLDMPLDMVENAVSGMFNDVVPYHSGTKSAPFQLYGKRVDLPETLPIA